MCGCSMSSRYTSNPQCDKPAADFAMHIGIFNDLKLNVSPVLFLEKLFQKLTGTNEKM